MFFLSWMTFVYCNITMCIHCNITMKTVPPFPHNNITTYFYICSKRDYLEIPFLFWNAFNMEIRLDIKLYKLDAKHSE